jgi:uncharacterized protein YjiS (DUF1127 family)
MARGEPDYSCNSVLVIRSPLGEIRIGDQRSTFPSPRPFRLLVRRFIRIRESLAQRRQPLALSEPDRGLPKDAGISKAEAGNENKRAFGHEPASRNG